MKRTNDLMVDLMGTKVLNNDESTVGICDQRVFQETAAIVCQSRQTHRSCSLFVECIM